MLGDNNLLNLEPFERAQMGIFLAFQYPVEIPGVSNMEFLKASIDSLAPEQEGKNSQILLTSCAR